MQDEQQQANRLESLALTLIFAAISVGLLAAIGVATRPGPASAGWWTRPWLAPGVALSLLVLANIVTLWRDLANLRNHPASAEEWHEARARIAGWLRPLEFLAYFAAYLWALKHLGYFLSTAVFILLLMLRVGLRSPRWIITGALTALALTAIFRMGLNIWMPAPDLYGLFPDGMRKLLIRWF
jgi:hypothetical protein